MVNLNKVHALIPGSVLYPESRISIPLYSGREIDLFKDGRVRYQHWSWHTGDVLQEFDIACIIPAKDRKDHSAAIADVVMQMVEIFMEELDERLKAIFREDENNDQADS